MFAVLLLIEFPSTSNAQFYYGHQMNFGKSRVQYKDFFWQYFRFQKFDTYFYVGGRELAVFTAQIADKKIKEIETTLEQPFGSRIIFIIYNKLPDFRQSNIGLVTGDDSYNIGGVTQIVNNKVFIYFEGDYGKFEKQITAAIAEVALSNVLYGSGIKDKVASSTLLSLPEWFTKGLVSYLANDWDVEIENKVKDGILSGKYAKFNSLTGKDAVYAGHSIWKFVTDKYGKSIISNIVYITKITKNVESGFMYVIGTGLKYMSFEWLDFYNQKYLEPSNQQYTPDGNGIVKKIKKRRVYNEVKVSPNGNKIAYVTNEYGQYKIWIYDKNTEKALRIFKKEHRLDQIVDYSIPLINWHPRGEVLTIITELKGELQLINYVLETEEYITKFLPYFEKVNDFSYSSDGLKIALSGVRNGISDVYVHHIAGNTNEQITKDFSEDFSPRFIENSSKIIFSSNRLLDTLKDETSIRAKTNNNFDLFIYDYANKKNNLIRLTNTEKANEFAAYEIEKNKFYAISDENGIKNRHQITLDSTISYIDTTTHYRYLSFDNPVTNYSRNIHQHDYNPTNNTFADILFLNNKYRIFLHSNTDNNLFSGTYQTSEYKKKQNVQLLEKEKPLSKETKKNIPIQFTRRDSSLVDTIKKDASDTTQNQFVLPQQTVYFTSFYYNQFVSQVDFSFLNTSYQTFSGVSGGYYNPGMSGLFKIGTSDLFEDYKITGTFRIPLDLNSVEYLISIENLKKRIDKQLVFHKQAYNSSDAYSIIKTQSHELFYLIKYPFSQVSALKLTLSSRYDRLDYLATDFYNLNQESKFNLWSGIKAEYIFDNSRDITLNIKEGVRMKIFGEFYKQINKKESELIVFGLDARHYQRIHKNLIWANRLAISTSLGRSRLIYFLGGVDNKLRLAEDPSKTFDYSIPIDTKHTYAYQAIATNMRGFIQNIRNGNSFFVYNSEVRLPIIKYFSNKPINSDFLGNLQVIGFFDLGSAWSGLTPFDKDNNYNYEIVNRESVTVIVDMERPALVYGYGFGLRTRMFGYFVRFDWAWGVEKDVVLPKVFYLSLSLDF